MDVGDTRDDLWPWNVADLSPPVEARFDRGVGEKDEEGPDRHTYQVSHVICVCLLYVLG